MDTQTQQTIGIRYLTPEKTKIFTGRLGSIHCVIDDKEAYANVYCLLCFPVTYPAKFISVNYTNEENKENEIGVIEDLTVFPEETRAIINASLHRQYFEQVITRVLAVKWEFGLLFFEVETSERKIEFMMRWQHDKAIEYGKNGKVLLDVYDNRFLIPSVDNLPSADRDRLRRFIYW
jgi:hypothetical protein